MQLGDRNVSVTRPNTMFDVQTSATTLNGKSVDAAAYIKEARIKNGSITNAKIGHLAVDTLELNGNSVTVPDYAESVTYTGLGSTTFQQMVELSIYLNVANPILIFWSITQGYTGGQKHWSVRIRHGGSTTFQRLSMFALDDFPSASIEVQGTVGLNTIYLDWGGDPTMQAEGHLVVLGAQK